VVIAFVSQRFLYGKVADRHTKQDFSNIDSGDGG
jgi:hypothetical protein